LNQQAVESGQQGFKLCEIVIVYRIFSREFLEEGMEQFDKDRVLHFER
jgi:hypothetical protein